MCTSPGVTSPNNYRRVFFAQVYAFQPLLKGLATDAKQLKKSSRTDAMYT